MKQKICECLSPKLNRARNQEVDITDRPEFLKQRAGPLAEALCQV